MGEVAAISVGASSVNAVGAVTGILAGASVVEWLHPAVRTRIE